MHAQANAKRKLIDYSESGAADSAVDREAYYANARK